VGLCFDLLVGGGGGGGGGLRRVFCASFVLRGGGESSVWVGFVWEGV